MYRIYYIFNGRLDYADFYIYEETATNYYSLINSGAKILRVRDCNGDNVNII